MKQWDPYKEFGRETIHGWCSRTNWDDGSKWDRDVHYRDKLGLKQVDFRNKKNSRCAAAVPDGLLKNPRLQVLAKELAQSSEFSPVFQTGSPPTTIDDCTDQGSITALLLHERPSLSSHFAILQFSGIHAIHRFSEKQARILNQ